MFAMMLAVALVQGAADAKPAGDACAGGTVAAGGGQVWAELLGAGETTVVFEAGNGNDATVWEALAPQVRAMGLRTLRYDRLGYGHSTPRPGRGYRVEMDLAALRGVLQRCGVSGPIVYVAHSYGGVLGVLGMARDARTRAMVMVDAVVPGAESAESVRAVQATLRPQYAEVRREAPALARTIIPVVEAMPRTVRLVNAARVPLALPVVDIVADGGSETEARKAEWRAAHRRFVAQAPESRRFVDATGSGHKVMNDRPDLIVDAIRAVALPAGRR